MKNDVTQHQNATQNEPDSHRGETSSSMGSGTHSAQPAVAAEPGRRTTVGQLLGLPQGLPVAEAAAVEGEYWIVEEGQVRAGPRRAIFSASGIELLTYNNPFRQLIERVWFNGRIVYALEAGQVPVDPAKVKVAQEYQIVYSVELDERGLPVREPERVPGQYNIYDSVPGMPEYSPLWQFNYVIVPRDYVPNTLRSAEDCLRSGYPIIRSNYVEN